VTRRYK